jgi:hypothetical protein
VPIPFGHEVERIGHSSIRIVDFDNRNVRQSKPSVVMVPLE